MQTQSFDGKHFWFPIHHRRRRRFSTPLSIPLCTDLWTVHVETEIIDSSPRKGCQVHVPAYTVGPVFEPHVVMKGVGRGKIISLLMNDGTKPGARHPGQCGRQEATLRRVFVHQTNDLQD